MPSDAITLRISFSSSSSTTRPIICKRSCSGPAAQSIPGFLPGTGRTSSQIQKDRFAAGRLESQVLAGDFLELEIGSRIGIADKTNYRNCAKQEPENENKTSAAKRPMSGTEE